MAFQNPVSTFLVSSSPKKNIVRNTMYSLQLTIDYLNERISGKNPLKAKTELEPNTDRHRFLLIGVKEVQGDFILNMKASLHKTFILLDNKLVWANASFGDKERPAATSLEDAKKFYQYMLGMLQNGDEEFVDFLKNA